MGRLKSERIVTPSAPELSPETFDALIQASDAFVAAKPWERMADAELFAVEDEALGWTGWTAVMGGAGDSFGLCSYLGDRGWSQLERLFSAGCGGDCGEDCSCEDEGEEKEGCGDEACSCEEEGGCGCGAPLDFDYSATLDMFAYCWAPKRELAPWDQALLQRLGTPKPGTLRFHQFIRYRPEYLPFLPDEKEARFMTRCLQAAVLVHQKLVEGVELFPEDGSIPKVRFTAQGAVEFGQGEPKAWEEPAPAPLEAQPDGFADLKALPRNQETWQLGDFYCPAQILDGNKRPYHGHMALCVEAAEGYAYQPEFMKPGSDRAKAAWAALAAAARKAAALPQTLEFRDEALLTALLPPMEGLGLIVRLSETLPAWEEAVAALRENLEEC
jgi:hypothetical protein